MKTFSVLSRPSGSMIFLASTLVCGCQKEFAKYLMFYHGEGPGKDNSIDTFVANCSIGIAWSDDLVSWDWPKP